VPVKTAEAVDVGGIVGSVVGVSTGSTAVLEAVGNGKEAETTGVTAGTAVGSWERAVVWLADGSD